MKEVTAAIENTSEYVRREIDRKKAMHDKDVTDLIKHEHSAYYQKVLDSSLAYDDLALHGERDLEKVCVRHSPCFCPISSVMEYSSRLRPPEERVSPNCRRYNSLSVYYFGGHDS
jgi:hypothetical protein